MNAASRSYLLAALALFALVLPACVDKVPEKTRSGSQQTVQTAPAAARPATIAGKKVLLVHSYHPDYPWVASITEGVQSALKDPGVELDVFYMDTKRKTDEAWKQEAGARARERVASWKPDVVITVDDNAQQYFATSYVGQALPFVFCGVNADPSKYGFPATNVTGIIERPHLGHALKYLKHVKPVRRVALLSSDDETSVGALNYMKEEALEDVQVVEWKLEGDFDAWKKTVQRLNRSGDAIGVYMYHTVKEKGSATSLDPKAVMAWTSENSKVPTFGFFDFGVEDGLLTGVVESGPEQGEKAGQYALAILKGTPPSQLPVVKADSGTRMLNAAAAKRMGLTPSAELLRDARVVGE